MYPTSNSSSSPSQPATNGTNNGGGIGLARYRSAPVSFLNNTVDSVINGSQDTPSGHQHTNTIITNQVIGGSIASRFFSPPADTASSSRAFRLNEFATTFNGLKPATATDESPSPLFRHGSSPAGFLNTLVSSTPTDGRASRLSSQISFTGTNSNYSQITEETNVTNPLVFSSSTSHNKRPNIDMESEFNFGLSEEASAMENQLPHESVSCKIRAKRGCATHPRSIAERERRTRISGKLKKLQDLVPNMDKQTSYSDMLDLAVQHIKGLQTHVQNLRQELDNCSCGCKPN